MIYEQINEYSFTDGFRRLDNYKDHFTYKGLKALYFWLDDLSTDQNIEFDPIALTCDFWQYDSMGDFWLDGYDQDDYPDIESIMNETMVIEIEDSESFIIQTF